MKIPLYILALMKTSKPIKGEEAQKLGLVDSVVSAGELIKTARQWALDIAECKRPWIKSLYKTDKIEPLGEAKEILKFARAQAQKQAPHLQHPLVCIDAIEEGIVSGPRAGLWKVLSLSFRQLLWNYNGYQAFKNCARTKFCRKLKHLMNFSSLTQAEA